MTVKPISTNEQAGNPGITHIATITHKDLTNTTAAAAQTLTIAPLKAGDMIVRVAWRIKSYFKNSADPAFNSDTMSVGDDGGVATHIAAAEVNGNAATPVRQGVSNTLVSYALANNLKVTFNSMAAKALDSLDQGEVEILFGVLRPAVLEEATAGTA
jgi:hypothetical protein